MGRRNRPEMVSDILSLAHSMVCGQSRHHCRRWRKIAVSAPRQDPVCSRVLDTVQRRFLGGVSHGRNTFGSGIQASLSSSRPQLWHGSATARGSAAAGHPSTYAPARTTFTPLWGLHSCMGPPKFGGCVMSWTVAGFAPRPPTQPFGEDHGTSGARRPPERPGRVFGFFVVCPSGIGKTPIGV